MSLSSFGDLRTMVPKFFFSTGVLCVFVGVRLTEHRKRRDVVKGKLSYFLSFVLKGFKQNKARDSAFQNAPKAGWIILVLSEWWLSS